MRRRGVGGDRDRNEYVAMVIEWLDTSPASTSTRDYNAWVAEVNAGRAEGQPRVVEAHSVNRQLGLRWPDTLRVARGETTLVDAQRQVADTTREHPYIAIGDLPAYLGVDA